MPATHTEASTAKVLNRIPPHFSAMEKVSMLVVADDTPPTLRRLARREWTRAHTARREAEASRGVRQSGIVTDAAPYDIASVEDLVREAAAEDERLARCPRARFYGALSRLEKVEQYAATAEEVRSLFNRDLADERQALNVRAVGAALAKLNGMAGDAARDARDCLAELLMGDARRAA